MLDTLDKKLQTTVLFILVLMLVAVFVLQFGNQQAEGFSSGGVDVAAKVGGNDITEGDFRALYSLAGFDRVPVEQQRVQNLRQLIMDGIIDRVVLADAAEEVGLTVSPEQAMERLVIDDTLMLTLGEGAGPFMPQGELRAGLRDENDQFDRERAQMYIRNVLRRSMGEFSEWQAQERMAERMRDAVRANVTVSDAEVWESYVQEQDRARLSYVQFRPGFYRNTLEPSDRELTAWMAEHQAEVDQEYTRQRSRYTEVPEQVRARHILFRARSSDDETERNVARQNAEAALRRVRAGEAFGALARELSEDTSSGRRGGDIGFVRRGQRSDAFEEALFALEMGTVSEVVETSQGFHVITAVARREGDVPEAEAKRELAERLYRESRSNEAAQQGAREALAFIREGGTMEELRGRLPGGDDEDGDPLAPRVAETSLFGRGENPIRGVSNPGPLVRLAFELTDEQPVAEEILQVGSDWFVVRLDERLRPTREAFDEATQRQLRASLLSAKQDDAVREQTRQLRNRAIQAGRVVVYPRILQYGDQGAAAAQGSSNS